MEVVFTQKEEVVVVKKIYNHSEFSFGRDFSPSIWNNNNNNKSMLIGYVYLQLYGALFYCIRVLLFLLEDF